MNTTMMNTQTRTHNERGNFFRQNGGGALKNKLCLSFCTLVALSEFAYANVCTQPMTTITGNSISQDCTLDNTHTTINIQKGGMLKKILINGGDISINNEGFILNSDMAGSNNTVNSFGIRLHNHSATLESLSNSGTIKGNEYGVNFDSVSGAVNIKNLSNSGTMQGTKNEGVFIGGEISVDKLSNLGLISGSQGFWITEKSSKFPTIKTLENSGSIQGNTRGIVLNKGTIETFKNSGTINGTSHAGVEIRTGSTINNIILDGSGASLNSEASSAYQAMENFSSKGGLHNRGFIENITVQNGAKIIGGGLINAATNNANGAQEGLIKSILVQSGGLIEGLENAKKIDKITVSGVNSKITTLNNTGTLGDVESKDGGEITALINSGNITGSVRLNEKTKSIENTGSITGSLTFNEALTKLVNKGTISNFTASKDIEELSNESALTLRGSGKISKSLSNEQNGKLSGVDIYFEGYSLHTLENKGTIENRIFNPSNSSLEFNNEGSISYLKNDGTLSKFENANNANLQALINSGNINANLDNKGSISSLENSGRVGSGLSNSGTISTLKNSGVIMGLKNSGTITSLENTGNIKPDSNKEHIKNENGKITVSKWYIPSTRAIPLTAHQNFSDIDDVDSRLVISGAKSSDVDFSQAEIYIDARFYDVNVEYDIKNSILLKNSPHRASAASPLSISDMKDSKAFEIIYTKDTGMFIINAHSEALLGAVFADFLLNYVTRRALFIDTLLWDRQASILSQSVEDKDFYFLPFYARDDFTLNTREAKSKANTNGFISGFHYFDGTSITELFLGFDEASSHTTIKDAKVDTRLDGEHKAFLMGLNHTRFLREEDDFSLAWQNAFKLAKRNAKLSLSEEGSDKQQDDVGILGLGLASYLEWQKLGEGYDLSFKFGGGYQGFKIGSFVLTTPNERQSVNLLYNTTSLSYTKYFKKLSTTLELGNRYLLDNKIKTHFKGDVDYFALPRNYSFAEFSSRFELNAKVHFDVSYNAILAKNGESHNGFLSLNYKY